MNNIVRVAYKLETEDSTKTEEQNLINAISSKDYLETSTLSKQIRRFFKGSDKEFESFESHHKLGITEKWKKENGDREYLDTKQINTRSKSYLLTLGEEQKKYERARTSHKTPTDREFSKQFSQALNGARYQNSLFLESHKFSYPDLTDGEFELFTNTFLQNHSPVAVVEFIKFDERNKQIEIVASTKVYFQEDKNEPVFFAYERDRKNYALPHKLINKNYNKANINLTVMAKELFDTFEKVFDNKIMLMDKGSNIIDSHSVLLGREETKEELDAIEACRSSRNLEKHNNNEQRGSMSPNTSKQYIEQKEIQNEEAFNPEKLMHNVTELSKKLFREDDTEQKTLVTQTDEENSHKKKMVLNTIPKNIVLNFEEQANQKQEEEKSKNLSSIKVLQLKQINEAEELATKELVLFKKDLAEGGGVISNIEKSIQRTIKHNPFAKQVFEALIKDAFLTMANKDNVINNYKKALIESYEVLDKQSENIEIIERVNGENTSKLMQLNTDLKADNQKLYTLLEVQEQEQEANLKMLNESLGKIKHLESSVAVKDEAITKQETVNQTLTQDVNDIKDERRVDKEEWRQDKTELREEIKIVNDKNRDLNFLWNESLGKIKFNEATITELKLINERLTVELADAKRELELTKEKEGLLSTTKDLKNEIDNVMAKTQEINESNLKINEVKISQSDEDDMFADVEVLEVETPTEKNEEALEQVRLNLFDEDIRELDTTSIENAIKEVKDIQQDVNTKSDEDISMQKESQVFSKTDKSKEARAWRKGKGN